MVYGGKTPRCSTSSKLIASNLSDVEHSGNAVPKFNPLTRGFVTHSITGITRLANPHRMI